MSRLFRSLFLALALMATAAADSQARIVRLSYLEGNVQLDRADGSGFSRAFLNMPLVEGASLWTKEDGRAEVEFEDGSTVRLTPNTIVAFGELRLRSDGSKSTSLDVKQGTAYFDVRQRDEDAFRVTIGTREITLNKNSHFRVIHELQPPEEFWVAVTKGELRFLNADGQFVNIRKNETLSFDFGDSARYFLARGISNEPHDYWDKERVQEREALAQRGRDIYASDLNRYGMYMDISGFGRVWRPYGVGLGWDPFGAGMWVYYVGVGPVWISNHVWGWTPYRYGSWIHIGGHGWCWRPGPVYTAWVPTPVVVNPPTGYVTPVVPTAIPRSPVIRVGRTGDTGDFRDPRSRETDLPVGLIQDRVRGLREADVRFPTRGVEGGGDRASDGYVDRRRRDGYQPAEDIRRLPSGVDLDKRMRGRRDGEIDAHQDNDTPVRTTIVTPGTVTPVPPVVQDRPMRTPRTEVVTPRPAAVTPVQPVIQDRPTRPPRDNPPPQRVDRVIPTPSGPPPQAAPRVAPPPPPAPRTERVRDGVKDQ